MKNEFSPMKTILAFDTATEALSVALQHGEQQYCHFEVAPRLHAQKILPLIDDMLKRAGIGIADVDAFVFGRGPGAFTGVRTAVAVVQGLAFTHNKPVYGVSTLLALAEAARREHGVTPVIPAIDARMGEVYVAAYVYANGEWQSMMAEAVLPPTKLSFAAAGAWYVCGTGWQVHGEVMQAQVHATLNREPGDGRLPDARDMLSLALPALARGEGVAADQALPVYLRDHVADKPKGLV